jgi:NhaP-type Na+/H+ or K+/H+ antiporter
MGVGFAEALAVVGGLLLASSALSGLIRRTILSTSVLAVGAGIVLSLAGVISLSAGDHALVLLVELVLLLTLFSDSLLVEGELLRRHWGPAARALVIAMPVNATALARSASRARRAATA